MARIFDVIPARQCPRGSEMNKNPSWRSHEVAVASRLSRIYEGFN
ncbi:hypothetical protein [Rickettsia endosymbiont of Ceutorhynchus obstrictus]